MRNRIFQLLLFIFICFPLFSQGDRGGSVDNVTKPKQLNVIALIVGISDYQNAKKLDYADDDAELMYKSLLETFPDSKKNIKKLIDKEASEYAIRKEIDSLYQKAKEGDLVIFYFAGHGDVTKTFGQESGYFLAYNASGSREYAAGGAVDFAFVNMGINAISAEKKAKVWLITDACRSGKIINQEGAKSTLTSLNQGFLNTTKFISCQAHEVSFEYKDLNHGAFTYYLVKGIGGEADSGEKNGSISIKELNEYLEIEVRKVTNNNQTPIVQGGDKYEDLVRANPILLSFIKTPVNSGDLASRGRGDDSGIKKSAILLRFEDALFKKQYYGNSTCAKEIYIQSKNSKSTNTSELEIMKDLLVERLLAESQQITNLFLAGQPEIPKNLNIKEAFSDLQVVLELMDKKSLFYKQVYNRSVFFKSMLILQKQESTKYNEAEKDLNDLIVKEPNSAYLHQGLAMLYLKMANKEMAEKELAIVSDLINTWDKPKNTGAYINIISGKLDVAKTLLKESEAISSNSSDLVLLKSKLYKANFELKKAEDILLKNVNDSLIDISEYRSIQADINLLRGRIGTAEKILKDMLSKEKNNVEILLQLADLYRSEKDTIKALIYYRNVVYIEPNNASAKYGLDILMNKTITSNSSTINYYDEQEVLRNVEILEKQGKFSEAILVIQKGIDVAPWNPDLHYHLGKLYYTSGSIKESENALKNALKASPYHFESVKSLTNLYLTQKKKVDAENVLKTYEPYFKESSKWYSFKYDTYNYLGYKKDLFVILEQAIKLDSLDTEPYRALFRLHIQNADFKNAQREFNQVINLGGRGRDSLDFLMRVRDQVNLQLSMGNYETSGEGLKVVLKFDPYDLQSIFDLSKVLYMFKDYKGSMRQLNEYQNYVLNMPASSQMEFYNLRGKVLIELEFYREAEESFRLASSKSQRPNYVGTAMAQFMQGKEVWKNNFVNDPNALPPYFNEKQFLLEYNSDALKRMKTMQKKVGSAKPNYSGGERRN